MSEATAAAFAAEILGPLDPISDEDEDPNPNPQGEPQDKGESQESKEGEASPSGEEKPNVDPLENITIDDLLKHPKLSSALNSFADRVANNRIQAEVSSKLTEQEEAIRDELLERYFGNLEESELGQVLAQDKNLAAEYGRLQQKQAPQGKLMTQEDLANAAQVEAARIQLRTNVKLITESDLSDDIKQTLHPNNYVTRGQQGLVDWTADIHKAIAKHEGTKNTKESVEEELEAERNRRAAERDESLPGASMAKGRVIKTMPDLFSKSSQELLEDAFAKRGNS